MLMSFLISDMLIKHVFLANTPYIRPNLGTYIADKTSSIFGKKQNSIASSLSPQDQSNLLYKATENIPYKALGGGVYAKEYKDIKIIEYRSGEVVWVEYTFNVDGKQAKVRVPKGQTPPPKSLVEKIY